MLVLLEPTALVRQDSGGEETVLNTVELHALLAALKTQYTIVKAASRHNDSSILVPVTDTIFIKMQEK